jgi:hypothetical protein
MNCHQHRLPAQKEGTYIILDLLPDDPSHLITINLNHRVLDYLSASAHLGLLRISSREEFHVPLILSPPAGVA